MKRTIEAIFVGTSAGGITALQRLLGALATDFDLPILVVQHLPPDAKIQPNLVFGQTHRAVEEAVDKTVVEKGHVYLAPPGYHLLVERNRQLSLSQDDPVHFARPSIDVLFESAAAAYGPSACGVLLTGANSDGAAGLRIIQECGGMTIVQDPNEAEASAMPKAALQLMTPDFIGRLDGISETLSNLVRGESWS